MVIVEHGEAERDMLAEAIVIDVVDIAEKGIYLFVESVGICAANNTAILELAFIDFYSSTNELALLVIADFKLD